MSLFIEYPTNWCFKEVGPFDAYKLSISFSGQRTIVWQVDHGGWLLECTPKRLHVAHNLHKMSLQKIKAFAGYEVAQCLSRIHNLKVKAFRKYKFMQMWCASTQFSVTLHACKNLHGITRVF